MQGLGSVGRCWATLEGRGCCLVPVDRWCGGIVGLRAWREHVILLANGPKSGITSAAPLVLERKLCEPTGRLRQPVLSALRDGCYVAALAAASWWVCVAAAHA